MRVLISGGGIAGLTLAYWLHQYSIPVVVVEQADGIHQDGYGMDFFGTGYDVAERMGLLGRLSQQRLPFEIVTYVDTDGHPTTWMKRALLDKIMHGRYMPLMRWTLQQALYEALADNVEVRFGTTLIAVNPGPDEVEVTFNDGTSACFDVLIGADGVHSHTRRLVFGADDLFQHELGYSFASYHLPDTYGIGHAWKNYVEPGRLAGVYCSNQEGKVVAFLMYWAEGEGHIPREKRLSHLQRVFVGMGWITQRLLQDVSHPNSIFLDTMTQIEMPRWYQGRVALVGDACGCSTSFSGQGASIAMGGAYILAHALHDIADPVTAFSRYEEQVRPPVEQIQKNARNIVNAFLPQTRLGVVTQRLALKLLLRDTFSPFLRQRFNAESFL